MSVENSTQCRRISRRFHVSFTHGISGVSWILNKTFRVWCISGRTRQHWTQQIECALSAWSMQNSHFDFLSHRCSHACVRAVNVIHTFSIVYLPFGLESNVCRSHEWRMTPANSFNTRVLQIDIISISAMLPLQWSFSLLAFPFDERVLHFSSILI